MFYKKAAPKTLDIHTKTPVLESLFDKAADLQDCWKTYLLHADLIYFILVKS